MQRVIRFYFEIYYNRRSAYGLEALRKRQGVNAEVKAPKGAGSSEYIQVLCDFDFGRWDCEGEPYVYEVLGIGESDIKRMREAKPGEVL